MAARFGLDPATALSVINTSSGRSGSTQVEFPELVLTRALDSGCTAALLEKDVRIAVDLAAALGVETPVSASVLAGWQAARAGLAPTADHTEVVLPDERSADVRLGGA